MSGDEQSELQGADPRDVRLGRILDDYLSRRSRGERVTEADLLSRHPELADDLREMLTMVRDLRPTSDKIDALIDQGMLKRSADSRYLAELGAYKITGYVGGGGMGIVLRAYQESLNRTVALKILRPELADDQAILARFEREAQAAASLGHSNIVTVHAVGREGNACFIAMEYVEGTDLAVLIRANGTLRTDVARRILGELLLGLEAAHDAGLIHRDIKPSNLLLDFGFSIGDFRLSDANQTAAPETRSQIENPRLKIVKIADFGLARMLSAQTRLTMPDSKPGTPEYMSPEQARGDEDIDHRTDLYSAGVVLYEMLTGRPPFRADSPTAVIHQILHDDPPDPAALNEAADPHLAALALRLMAKSPADRFASAAEVMHALDANRPIRRPPRCRKSRREIIAALAALPVVGLGAWLAWRFAAPTQPTSSGPATAAPPRIWKVKVDDEFPNVVFACFDNDPSWERFVGFDDAVALNAAVVADADGRGRQIVVIAAAKPLDRNNNVLVAFEWDGAEKREKWKMPLHSDLQWPDCPGTPRDWWGASKLRSADLDGDGADEIIVAASDPDEYPTRVSIIDPRGDPPHNIRHTFWHFGQLSWIEVLVDFFGKGQSAILAWGVNNKLDGFGDPPRPGDEGYQRYTQYSKVPVVMILDPRSMDGLGPPRTQQASLESLKPATPFAYAYLDVATGTTEYFPDGGTEFVRPEPREINSISRVEVSRRGVLDTWRLTITAAGPKITVDGNLRWVDVLFGDPAENKDEDFWKARWHVIIQNGKYVDP